MGGGVWGGQGGGGGAVGAGSEAEEVVQGEGGVGAFGEAAGLGEGGVVSGVALGGAWARRERAVGVQVRPVGVGGEAAEVHGVGVEERLRDVGGGHGGVWLVLLCGLVI